MGRQDLKINPQVFGVPTPPPGTYVTAPFSSTHSVKQQDNTSNVSQVHGIGSVFNVQDFGASPDGKTDSSQNMTITAPEESPNTDGIHIGDSNDIIINKVNISTGDDCVSIGAGTANVHISEVNCGPGHGISIGSLGKYQNEGDVNGVIVTNCNIGKTQNGVRIKSWAPSPPSKVFNGESQVQISDVKFINIKGTSASKEGVVLDCSKSVPCQGIELRGLELTLNGQQTTTATCSNANMNFFGPQTPSQCT
ncbi:hypothetical protein RDI58_004817 [Solanum bulbocastanum]|uniref:Polygalacturonase n=1 Tax=Solanum bulbocastanum TaxID=147425 RepID=A0AAN8TZD1_SOLBU